MKTVGYTFLFTLLITLATSPVYSQQDLVYVAVEPCRVADTRNGQGFIPANTARNFKVAGKLEELISQGGVVDCENPRASDGQVPVAIAAYILAVPDDSSTGRGVLSAYPSDKEAPPVGSGSTVNFQTAPIGNTSIVTVCSSNSCPTTGELAIISRGSNEHVVVDVQGYFYPAVANGLSASQASTVSVNAGDSTELISINLVIPTDGTLILSYTGVAQFDGGTGISCNPTESGGGPVIAAETGNTESIPLSGTGVYFVEAGNFSLTMECVSDGPVSVSNNNLSAVFSSRNIGVF